ncbi:hypothetical protein SAMN05421663_102413 [Terribacillus halophilus]|uniref:Uncharacterized protein n=1 Tax=Terribacillus halophilus TaxID=361279 RepID=A0A1G6LJY9_9BACI|nr:hypothetical protein [Terribacillus halophilus]SDC43523.1 hypothetical protein SAMN05421663_102413 [Terribacillus halophilus]
MDYKKTIVFVSGVLFASVVLLLIFQRNENPSEPTSPDLKVHAGEEVITAKRGGYCWNENGKAVCVDAADPAEDLDEDQGLRAVSGGNVELEFDSPPEVIEIEGKSEGGRWEELQMNDLQLKLPEPKDNYIYRISGQWEQGDVTYAFLVKAE